MSNLSYRDTILAHLEMSYIMDTNHDIAASDMTWGDMILDDPEISLDSMQALGVR